MPAHNVFFNDFGRQWEDTRDAMILAFEAVGESGWYVLGSEVRDFERALAGLFGVCHVIGVASGLDALEISLRALGCRAGMKVLTSPVTAFATTLAIVRIGAVPVFADVDAHGLVDLGACEEALQRDPAIRFFVPVHLYGHSLDLEVLRRLRARYEVRIVEDCAQSIGARFKGVKAGAAGEMAATSFYPTKNLGALGDGGAVMTDDEDLAEMARRLRDYGQTAKYRHEHIGMNSRLDELHAGLLRRVGLEKLPEWTSRRVEIAARYNEEIRNPGISLPSAPPGSESVWHLFPVLVSPGRKESFMAHQQSKGVGVAEHYPLPVYAQPAMAKVEHQVIGDCKNARAWCNSEVSLPIHPYLRDEDVRYIVDVCNHWEG